MAVYREVRPRRTIVARLDFHADLLTELTEICQREDIRLGRITGIGALTQAKLGFYHQESRQYQTLVLDHPVEILSLLGNVSIKDGLPFVHAHAVLGNDKGYAFGGHLMTGSTVFACEVQIDELGGEEFTRGHDDQTGLTLWQLDRK